MESEEYKLFIKGRFGGAAQPNANAKVLGGAYVTVPPTKIQAMYSKAVSPMFDLIDTTVSQNRFLAASRDLLLPRLISGDLSVAAAERELETAA
jgi:type I restriction enzyme S subunit